MNIQQLSANIDHKLIKLDRQIETLQHRIAAGTEESDQLTKDLRALENIKSKLVKSQAIMWQAHSLQNQEDKNALRNRRLLGIALLVFSGTGMLAIIISVFLR